MSNDTHNTWRLETPGEPIQQPETAIKLPQQQRAGVRGDLAAVETRLHATAFYGFKFEQSRVTLCLHRGTSGIWVSV